MPGGAAGVGHDRPRLGHQAHKPRGRSSRHEHGPIRKGFQVVIFRHVSGRADADTGAADFAALHQERAAGDWFFGAARLGRKAQRPRLQQDESALLAERPFHILGASEMGFQLQRPPCQLDRLFVRDAGLFGFARPQIFFLQAGARGEHHAALLRGGAPQELPSVGIPWNLQHLGGSAPIHEHHPQPLDGVDENLARIGPVGVSRKPHPARCRVHHADASHRHLGGFPGNAVQEPVIHGFRGIEACGHAQISTAELVSSDIEDGKKLARKGEVTVLPDGARADGGGHRLSGSFNQAVIG